ncbi:Hsp70 family protein [Haliangium ochraceum]|uniref:Heat shock protein 70 n=1 Tax=Haliangium ochraceum (strain DSM 14365 / JCM 11303 / SMP-2) TaxID=502025 RepID=D0LK31_HALO1|nr:Hsp70 family protein [Haliangium ochraceum]ACY13065.1 Heat shock protein 70 [Haliangium ochraceum DSM 14365]
MSFRTIGIDLGTTNSVVATIDRDGVPRILTSEEGETTTPSMISVIEQQGRQNLAVGAEARRLANHHPQDTIFAVKRLIGRRFDEPDVRRLSVALPYRISCAPNGDAWVTASSTTMSPPEVSALILQEMRGVAERFFGEPVGEAIITVPAYFDNQQRQATKDAAEIAGLKVRRLLNEPTAAALGYGAHLGESRRIAVCDLGGGTFDVSIVNVESGVFEVISTHGDAFLGGDDFDRTIVGQLVGEVWAEYGIDLGTDASALHMLKAEAQAAKHALTNSEDVNIELRSLGSLPSGKPLDFRRSISRRELEQWTEPLVNRLEPPCLEALAHCGLEPGDVGAVILVGGMTRMPAVQRRLAKIFGRQPLKVENPEEIVAVGAAIQCAVLEGGVDGVVLLDVTSRPLALSVEGGPARQVIPRNATIPTREHRIITTAHDNQRELSFDVYEVQDGLPVKNRHLGRFVCSDLPPAPAGEIVLLVEFTIDFDGILRVTTTELGSGAHPTLRLVATAGLTRADVKRLAKSLAPQR